MRKVAPIASDFFYGTPLDPNPATRSVLTSTGSSSFVTTGRYDGLIQAITPNSVFLSAGPLRFETMDTIYKIPAFTANAGVSWVAEGGTASATDPTGTAISAQPDKLVCLIEASTEVLADNPRLQEAAAVSMARAFGTAIDAAAFEGNSSHITGLHANALAGTADAGGALGNLDAFGSAFGLAAAQGVQIGDLVTVTPPTVFTWLSSLHVDGGSGTASTYDVRPLISTDLTNAGGAAVSYGRLLGQPWYQSSGLTVSGGTAYALTYDPNFTAFVSRQGFELLVDPYTKAEQGLVRLIGTIRAWAGAVNSKAVAQIDDIEAPA